MKYPSKTQSTPDKRFFLAVGIIAIIISTIVAVVYSLKYQSPQPTEPATDEDSHYTSQDSTTTEPSSSPDQPSSTTSNPNSETPSSSPSSSSNSSPSKPSDAQDTTPATPTDNQSSHYSTPQENYTPTHEGGSSSNCLHYEAGRCWDDLEDEAYSTGLYDRQNGYYGASVYYDEDCDAICQDILDDAYDEGLYDSY